MPTFTEEQLKESEERKGKFLEKYKTLIDEFQCDFIAFPQFVPAKNGAFELRVVNDIMDKKLVMGMKSPFVVGGGGKDENFATT